MALKVGIARFLGTNCDEDVRRWVEAFSGQSHYLWFADQFSTDDYDMVVIPGGFSHGDYLRCGALAARTPVMRSVREFAKKGKPILGICNGFQILCEANLLPGALIQNSSLRFKDEWAKLKVQNVSGRFAQKMQKGQALKLPIAHGEGRYYADADTLKKISDHGQIWLTYEKNPNGSMLDIAGVTNEGGNVYGLMPHPERAFSEWMGSNDGMYFI